MSSGSVKSMVEGRAYGLGSSGAESEAESGTEAQNQAAVGQQNTEIRGHCVRLKEGG